MATRRADPHRSTSDVEWDFSFVGAPLQRPTPGQSQPHPTWSESELPDWDFSFAGPRIDRSTDAAADQVDDVEQMWDFSFAGPRIDRSSPGRTEGRAEPDMEWDFSFVDGVEPGAEPRVDDRGADSVDALVDDQPADDDELNEWPPPASTGEIRRPAAADAADVVSDGAAPDAAASEVADPDATDELPRDELSPAAIAALPTTQVPVVQAEAAEPSSPSASSPAKAAAKPAAATPAAPAPGGPIRILTVCTHNRTRSVMSMAMLQAGFDQLLGPGKVMVRSLGFGPEGEPAIEDAVDEMARRDLHVERHKSMQVTAERIGPADLILCSEKQHVIQIAEIDADAFRRSFTLPEFCSLAAGDPVPGKRTLREWMQSMSSARTPAKYLAIDVPEVADPTGAPKREFAEATRAIEAMCDAVVDVISAAV